MQRILNFFKSKSTTRTSLFLTIAVALWLPASAMADIVSGRIFGPDDKPLISGSFTAKNAKGEATTFKSDKAGNFSVYLDAGKFTITSAADTTITAVIESFPQPRQIDIHLKKPEGK